MGYQYPLKKGSLYQKKDKNSVICLSCGHRCVIPEGKTGICKMRINKSGDLYVPYGYVSALNCDPIEKKPFFHVLPGATKLGDISISKRP